MFKFITPLVVCVIVHSCSCNNGQILRDDRGILLWELIKRQGNVHVMFKENLAMLCLLNKMSMLIPLLYMKRFWVGETRRTALITDFISSCHWFVVSAPSANITEWIWSPVIGLPGHGMILNDMNWLYDIPRCYFVIFHAKCHFVGQILISCELEM